MGLSQLEMDLYQQMILEHNRKPRNFKELPDASYSAEGFNPLCGDHLWVYVKTDDDGKIEEISFSGTGCAISKASASMMTITLKGKTMEEAEGVFDEFRRLIIGDLEPEKAQALGKLKVFAGICRYPSRVKCAGLAWHTMHGAMAEVSKKVSTE